MTASHQASRDMLRSFVERIENIEHEISERNDDKRDVYAEAKGSGFDVKALKAVIARRRKDVSEIEEHEAIVETYLAALAGGILPERKSPERRPRADFQPPRSSPTPLADIKIAHKAGNPISQDEKFETASIYFAHFKELGRLKIGISTNIAARMEVLRKGCGCEPSLIGLIEGNRHEELRALEHFASWKIEGEWFAFDDACAAAVSEYLARDMHSRARARDAQPEPSSARQSTSSLSRGESEPAVTQACGRAEAITEFPDIPAGLRRTA